MTEDRIEFLEKLHAKQHPSTPDAGSQASKTPSLKTVIDKVKEHHEELQEIEDVRFDIHKFVKIVGRKNALSTLSMAMLQRCGIYESSMPQLNFQRLTKFFGKIYQGYRRDVEYHNDIHGADVAQMMLIFIKSGADGKAELAGLAVDHDRSRLP
jgi:hypothetical protein